MPNPRPRTIPARIQDEAWIESPVPRKAAIERFEWNGNTGEISLSIRLNARTPRTVINKAVDKILTWALFEFTRFGQVSPKMAERRAVVQAWSTSHPGTRRRTRAHIARETGIPEHHVKIILRDWRAFLRAWDSPENVKIRKRVMRRHPSYDGPLFERDMHFITLGRYAGDLS